MTRPAAIAVALALLGATPLAAQQRDPLDRARTLYNERQYDAAITAADEVRRLPDRSDSADLIAARALLERFRETEESEHLARARERLQRISPAKFGTRERVEFIVGLGQALYFENAVGAAAATFDSVLLLRSELSPDARERMLDWWASALDQDAKLRPEIDRQAIYQRVRDRMAEELSVNAASATAAYWASAAARNQGDLQAAWNAAQAGWVRAPLTLDRAATLRTDLDQLVQKAIVPERARILGKPPEMLLAEWEQFKERWGK
jgi:hypothetical protein